MAGQAASAQGTLAPIGSIIAEQSRTAFSIQGAGARATGLGGAFIALADDATAVSFNPAGLAQMVRPEISFVGRAINRDVAFQNGQTVAGSRTSLVDDSLISNTRLDPLLLAGTIPLRIGGRTLAIQLSAQRIIPLGEGDTRNMQEHPVDGSASTQLHQGIGQTGQIDLYSFALAYEASQRILLGFSLNTWQGAWKLDSDSRSSAAGTTSYVDFDQQNRMEGWNFNFGLLWRWPTWSLGLVHRTAFHADYTYSAVYNTSTLAAPIQARPYDTGLHWPSTTGVGFAYRPTDRWVATLDLLRTPWSQARYMSARPQLDGLDFFSMSSTSRSPDVTQLHMGVEHLLLSRSGTVVPLRFGYSREPQPVTDAVTGEQRIMNGLSAGTGIKRGRYTFDLAYRYAWSRRQASQFLDPGQILSGTRATTVGRESITEHRMVGTLTVQFERAPVQDLLHHLFVGD